MASYEGNGKQRGDGRGRVRPRCTNAGSSRLVAVLSFLTDFFEDRVVGVLHGFVSLLFAPEISMEHGEREYGECQRERHVRLPDGSRNVLFPASKTEAYNV
jgi:predicted metalloprotease